MLGKKDLIAQYIKEVFLPVDGRPDLVVIRLKDGRQVTCGDSCPLTTEEYLKVVGGTVEPTTERLQFTDLEQGDIDAAEDCLTRASALADTLYEDGRKLDEELRAACPSAAFGDTPLTEEQAELIQNIEAQLHELRGRVERSGKLESRALVERNTIQQRITSAARLRQFPVQLHKPTRSVDDQLSDLEGSE